MELLLSCLVLLQVLCLGCSYPNGAPTSACQDMTPRHAGVQPQTSPVPYTVLTDSNILKPGQPITVTIAGPEYSGLLLEARTGGSSAAVGNWQLPPPNTRFLECSGNPQGAITHSNTNPKGNSTTYTWIPPSSPSTAYFMITIAQQRTVYWLNVTSGTLTSVPVGGGVGLASGNPLILLAICLLLVSQVVY